MQLRITSFLFLLLTPVFAQAMDNVSIADYYKGRHLTEKNLAPPGFKETARAKGDLNGDGVDDIALLAKVATDPSDINPNQNILLFSGNKSGGYTFWKFGAHHFTGAHSEYVNPNGIDIFKIEKGVLTAGTSVEMAAGGWYTGGCTEKWRNDKAGFRLIGLDADYYNRQTTVENSQDTNYLAGLTIYKTENDSADNKDSEKIKKVKTTPKTVLWENFDFDKYCEIAE